MWKKWTKVDKVLFLVDAGILLGWVYLENTYQNCISFKLFVCVAFLIFLAASILVRNFGARKSVVAGIGIAFLLDCAAIYACLPADTYAEGRVRMEEQWLGEYGTVELMGETRDYIGYFTDYDMESPVQRFFNKIAGRSDEPVIRRRPYVYIFGADKDIIACIYDPFEGKSRIGVLENVRHTDWKKALVMGGYAWTEG